MVIQGVSYPSDFEAKKQMIEVGRRLDEKGHVIAGEGSLSVRVGPNAVWITAQGAEKGALKQENFIRVDMNGKQSPGSRQTRLPEDAAVHLSIYTQNPALRGIIHGYPAGAVAYAALGREVQAADYTPSVRALGRISLIPSGNTEAQAKAAALVCRTDKGMLAAGDGCYMWGENLTEAFHQIEALEYYVKVSRLLCAGRGAAAYGPDGSGYGSGGACEPDGSGYGSGAGACGPDGSGYGAGAGESVYVPGSGVCGYGVKTAAGAVSEMGAAERMTEPLEMDGLTPLICPGDAAGFTLPSGQEKNGNSTGTVPKAAAAAAPTLKQAAMPVVARAVLPMTGQNVVPAAGQTASKAFGTASHEQAASKTAGAVSREQMMAEVIRRSLASL